MLSKISLSENKLSVQMNISTNDTNLLSDFENDIEKYFEFSNKVAVLNSGTSAIHLALVLTNVQRGDEVLCQSFTFSASVNPILYQGASPVFIDSEPETWNMCPEALEKAINDRISRKKKPKAIIVVHLYGMPAKMDEISAISKKYEITLIEDAAEALGSTYKGQKCGTFGDYGILSFNSNKIISAFGGGALVCKTQVEKEKAIFLATQAKDEAPHYQHSQIGYNYRMSNVLASIARGQMEVLDMQIALRRNMQQFYKNLFQDTIGITVCEEPSQDFFSNHWLSCILVKEIKFGFSREDLRTSLLEDNIETRPLWKPMHLQPIFEKHPFYGSNVCENLFNIGLCLPSGTNLSENDKRRIKNSITKFL